MDDEVLGADEVVVIRGSGYDPRRRKDHVRLATERSSVSIAAIGRLLLDVVPDDGTYAWMEMPVMSVAFVSASAVITEFGLLGDHEWVRSGGGGDHELADADGVRDWLASHGVALV